MSSSQEGGSEKGPSETPTKVAPTTDSSKESAKLMSHIQSFMGSSFRGGETCRDTSSPLRQALEERVTSFEFDGATSRLKTLDVDASGKAVKGRVLSASLRKVQAPYQSSKAAQTTALTSANDSKDMEQKQEAMRGEASAIASLPSKGQEAEVPPPPPAP